MTAEAAAILSLVLAERREEARHLPADSDPLEEHYW